MKTKAALMAIGLAFGLWGFGITAEHPEHPTAASKEHPNKGSAVQQKSAQDEYEKFVKDYVASEAQKTGGVYKIHDDAANKDWKLELVKVHKNRICMLNEGKTCFACADLKEVGGKNKVDLDFYANHSPDGKMTMDKVWIHKVNGKPRFTYDKNNNMAPLK